jgi:hypothetical protein
MSSTGFISRCETNVNLKDCLVSGYLFDHLTGHVQIISCDLLNLFIRDVVLRGTRSRKEIMSVVAYPAPRNPRKD